jgi:hypothetical protein
MVTDFVPSSNAKDAVVADPDQPVISASPASAQRVIPPVPFTAIGCAVKWLAERRPDPHNGERDHNEDRDDDFAPHAATVATADPFLWWRPCGNSVPSAASVHSLEPRVAAVGSSPHTSRGV